MHAAKGPGPVFYFALPRLIARLTGRNGARGDKSSLEANIASLCFFAVTYLFAYLSIRSQRPLWAAAALIILPVFATWIFWLIAFYVNSLLIRMGRSVGLSGAIPTYRAQSVLIGTETTAFACALLLHGGWMAVIGVIWLIGVALNLASAVVLALIDGTSAE